MKRGLLLLGLFLLFGVSLAFLMQRAMHDPAPSAPPPVVEPDTLVDDPPDAEDPPAPPSDSTGTGWHEAPPDSVPPPDPDRPRGQGRGHGREDPDA